MPLPSTDQMPPLDDARNRVKPRVSDPRTGRSSVVAGRSGLQIAGPEPANPLQLTLDGGLDAAQLGGNLGVGAPLELPRRQAERLRRGRAGPSGDGTARQPARPARPSACRRGRRLDLGSVELREQKDVSPAATGTPLPAGQGQGFADRHDDQQPPEVVAVLETGEVPASARRQTL